MSISYKNANNLYDLYTFDKIYDSGEVLDPVNDGVFVGRFISQDTSIYQKILSSDGTYVYKLIGNLAPHVNIIPPEESLGDSATLSDIKYLLKVTKDDTTGTITLDSPLSLLSNSEKDIYSSVKIIKCDGFGKETSSEAEQTAGIQGIYSNATSGTFNNWMYATVINNNIYFLYKYESSSAVVAYFCNSYLNQQIVLTLNNATSGVWGDSFESKPNMMNIEEIDSTAVAEYGLLLRSLNSNDTSTDELNYTSDVSISFTDSDDADAAADIITLTAPKISTTSLSVASGANSSSITPTSISAQQITPSSFLSLTSSNIHVVTSVSASEDLAGRTISKNDIVFLKV